MHILWRSVVALAAALGIATLSLSASAAPTVVELFTSQGCSSCPPADEFHAQLAKRPGVLALGFHVDYWDYLGWKDPFSSAAATARQRAYGRSMRLRTVYTPQIIVGGRQEGVGSDTRAVEKAIREVAAEPGIDLDIGWKQDGDAAKITIPAAAYRGPPATIWLALYDRSITTTIKRGENAGRTITYANIVRSIRKIGTWKGRAVVVEIPMAFLGVGDRDGCAIIVQEAGSGPILGALDVALDIAPDGQRK